MSSTRWTRAGPGSPRGRASPPRDRRRPRRRRRPRDARARRAPSRPRARGERKALRRLPRRGLEAGRDRRRRRLGRRGGEGGPRGLGTRAEREERVVHPAVSCIRRAVVSPRARRGKGGGLGGVRDADGHGGASGGTAAPRCRRAARARGRVRRVARRFRRRHRVGARRREGIRAGHHRSGNLRGQRVRTHARRLLLLPLRSGPLPLLRGGRLLRAARRVAALGARRLGAGRFGARRRLLGVGGASLRLGQKPANALRLLGALRLARLRGDTRDAHRGPLMLERPLAFSASSARSGLEPRAYLRARARFQSRALALLRLDARAHRQPELVLALHAAHGVLLVLDARDRRALRLDQRASGRALLRLDCLARRRLRLGASRRLGLGLRLRLRPRLRRRADPSLLRLRLGEGARRLPSLRQRARLLGGEEFGLGLGARARAAGRPARARARRSLELGAHGRRLRGVLRRQTRLGARLRLRERLARLPPRARRRGGSRRREPPRCSLQKLDTSARRDVQVASPRRRRVAFAARARAAGATAARPLRAASRGDGAAGDAGTPVGESAEFGESGPESESGAFSRPADSREGEAPSASPKARAKAFAFPAASSATGSTVASASARAHDFATSSVANRNANASPLGSVSATTARARLALLAFLPSGSEPSGSEPEFWTSLPSAFRFVLSSAVTSAPSVRLAVARGTPARSPRSTSSFPGTSTRNRAGATSLYVFETPVSAPRFSGARYW